MEPGGVTDSAASLLTWAANLIETVAKSTTQGEWRIEDHGIHTASESVCSFGRHEGGYGMREDLAWSVMMQPRIAPPLVEWLRDAARRAEANPHLSPEGSTMQRTALAFARAVLGEE